MGVQCAAHIDVGRVGRRLHNARVYLGPRECKAKYQSHSINWQVPVRKVLTPQCMWLGTIRLLRVMTMFFSG